MPYGPHMAFVIALDKPIRKGNDQYQHLVIETSMVPDEVVANMDDATLQTYYAGKLKQLMRGPLCDLIATIFMFITNKKVFIPGIIAVQCL